MKLGLFYTNRRKDYNRLAASHWIRILQMIPVYKKAGISVSFNNLFKRYDAVILFRKSNKEYYRILLFLKLISKKVYFDTCINLFELNEEITPQKLRYAKKIGKITDGFICASHKIAEYSAFHTRSVCVMEDSINLDHFKFIKQNINFENPVFGWSGVPHKAVFLNKFAGEVSGNTILITHDLIKNIEIDFEYEFINWKYETFPAEIQKCDIALLPRSVDDSYNNCHSSFKALVFAVSGIPIIANKVPSYVRMSEYYNGIVFLEDYENNLNQCIQALKTRSLDTSKVRQYYSRENQAELLITFLKNNQ